MATKTNYLDRYDLNNDFDKIIDDPWYHFRSLGLCERDIINLAGGIPCEEIGRCKLIIDTHMNQQFDVYIETPEFEVQREIDFATMSIQNSLMKVTDKGKGLGTFLLANQVASARQFGFERLEVHAAGGVDYDNDPDWNGYYTWGRAGFLMDNRAQEEFDEWLKEKPFKVKYLHELLETEFGVRVWKTLGFSWNGYFDLSDDSKSLEILRKYLLKRGIKKLL